MANPDFGRPSIIRIVRERPLEQQTGPLLRIPVEVRENIYAFILTPDPERDPPRGAGIHTAILRTCRQVAHEASIYLYSVPHVIRYSSTLEPHWRAINASSLRFLQSLVIRLEYSTINRGECEVSVQHAERIAGFTEGIMLTLQHSRALKTLHVELCNLAQRKVGKKRIRSETTMDQVKGILWPFAALPVSQKVTVGGFDTVSLCS